MKTRDNLRNLATRYTQPDKGLIYIKSVYFREPHHTELPVEVPLGRVPTKGLGADTQGSYQRANETRAVITVC